MEYLPATRQDLAVDSDDDLLACDCFSSSLAVNLEAIQPPVPSRILPIRGLAARHLHAVQAGLPPPALPDKLGFGERPHRHVLDDMTRFQDMCRELGVGPGDLVSLADLQKGRACHRIASCLWDLASILRRGGHAEVCESLGERGAA